MVLHQKNENKLSDFYFEKGTLYHIVPGNKGRVLDGRRTPGFIENYDDESAMFIWRITDFEDKGKYWQVPAEEISAYQFEKDSKKLTQVKMEEIEFKCKIFSGKLEIYGSQSEYKKTLTLIEEEKHKAKNWFINQSQFVSLGESQLDIKSNVGLQFLYSDLISYMDTCGVLDLETKTANQYLLNPYSGEWIKGLRIVMAEMGLIDFNEKRPELMMFSKVLVVKIKEDGILFHVWLLYKPSLNCLDIKRCNYLEVWLQKEYYLKNLEHYYRHHLTLKLARHFQTLIEMNRLRSHIL